MNVFKVYFILLMSFISCRNNHVQSVQTKQTEDIGNNHFSKEVNYIPYYNEIYKADSLYITKNYKETYEILDRLLKTYKPVDGWFVNVSRNYLISKSKASTIEREDVENYLREKAYDVNAVLKDKSIAELLEKLNISKDDVEKIVKENVSKINLPLRSELNKMNIDDQDVRNRLNTEDSIKKVDWRHSERLKEIIKIYGFPNKNLIGGYMVQGKSADVSLSVIFNHLSYNGDYEYFKKTLPNLVKNGTCDPFNYAMMEDRKNEINNKPIDYHVIIAIDENVDKKKINTNRRAIGLPSLEYQEFKKKLMSN